MGFIVDLGKGKYRLFAETERRAGKRRRKTKVVNAKNKTEANKFLKLFEQEVSANQNIYFGKHHNVTLNDLYKMWVTRHAVKEYAPKTYTDTVNILTKRVLPVFGKMKVKDIKKIDVDLFFSDLQEKGARLDGKKGTLSSSSVHNIYKAFNAMMKAAHEWEIIESNPCQGVKLPRLKYKPGSAYNDEEIIILWDALKTVPVANQLIVQIALTAGCRAGEIAALEAKHIDKVGSTIKIEQSISYKDGKVIVKSTKSDRSRTVSLPKELINRLHKHKIKKQSELLAAGNEREWPDHQFLFSNELGRPLRPDSISQFWSRFVERNKLRKIRLHDLRHTSATRLINRGVHAKVIQERLGHATIGTTMNVYGHVLEKADQTAAAHFDDLFSDKKTSKK